MAKQKEKTKKQKARLKLLNKPINTITARALADQEILPTIKTLRHENYSYERIAKSLNKQGYKTRRGDKGCPKEWTLKLWPVVNRL